MFKILDFFGFSGHADLLLLAERATTLLADEIRSLRDEVEVAWEAVPTPHDSRGAFLELRLKLPHSTGIVRTLLVERDFADERRLRSICRSLWGKLLDTHLEQGRARLTELLSEPVEA